MKKQYLQGSIIKAEGGNIEFIASDETKDRHGDVIPLDSWDLKRFKEAPRMLIDHWHSVENIVGKWTDVHIDKNSDRPGLKMTAKFHDITQLAKETAEMVKQGFLDTVSVGFIPHRDSGVDADGEEYSVQRNELIEVSLVTVPANPNAVALKSLMEKGRDRNDDEIDNIEKFLDVQKKDETVDNSVDKVEADEVIENEIKPKEKQLDTPKAIRKSKGRRLSAKDKKLLIAKKTLKESAKAISFALYQINKK